MQAVGLPSFSEELAHWLMAASDYVLVPSRFEPCGLVAQCAVRCSMIACLFGQMRCLWWGDGAGIPCYEDCGLVGRMFS